MANPALIEDLRKQFADNPRRVFARLANEYRKSGDLEAAIEICRAHVPLQPTYISGYIVLGQALFESGQLDEARSTFETALSLDPENLIALRQLGDIARASGDIDAARTWYHKLLEVDPQNEDIAAQLHELEAPLQPQAAEEESVSWSDIHPDSDGEVTPLSPQAMQSTRPRFTIGVIPENLPPEQPTVNEPVATVLPEPEPVAQRELVEEDETPVPTSSEASTSAALPEYLAGYDRRAPTPPMGAEAIGANAMADLEFSAPELVNVDDLAPDFEDHAEAELSQMSSTAEIVASIPDDVEKPAAPPATAAELAELFASPELEVPKAGVKTSEQDHSATFEEEPYDPTIGRMLELSDRTSSDALLPDLMMTESGAELLREQGHIDQAIYVYRHLAAKNPDDASYSERIAALERGAHSSIPLVASISESVISAARNREHSTQSIRTFFTSFANRRAPAMAESGAESASAASPVEEPMEATVESAPEAPAATEAPVVADAPAASISADDRSALETLFSGSAKVAEHDERAAATLASAFSEEYAADPNAPAGQPTRAASDSLSLDAVFQNTRSRDGDARASQSAVSFDEFFANRDNGASTEGKGDTAVQTASRSEDSQSDLELFHEWLDGLKK